jgi:hypothetical protein
VTRRSATEGTACADFRIRSTLPLLLLPNGEDSSFGLVENGPFG